MKYHYIIALFYIVFSFGSHAATMIEAAGKNHKWVTLFDQNTLAIKIDGKLEYLWNFDKDEAIWRGKNNYWLISLSKQQDQIKSFWDGLELIQYIMLLKTPCSQWNNLQWDNQRYPVVRECFGYRLSELHGPGSPLFDRVDRFNFPFIQLRCTWTSTKLATLAKNTLNNPKFNDWVSKPRKTLFLHPLTLFYSYGNNSDNLDKIRYAGTNSLTIYAEDNESCQTAPPPTLKVTSINSIYDFIQRPSAQQLKEFEHERELYFNSSDKNEDEDKIY